MRALEGHLIEIIDELSQLTTIAAGILVFLIVSKIIDKVIR